MAENKIKILRASLPFTFMFIFLFGLVVGASIVYLVAMKGIQNSRIANSEVKGQFFGAESATVHGTVSAFDQNSVTIKNDQEVSQTFALSPQVTIMKPGSIKAGVATSSAQTNQLEKDQTATFSLVKINGSYTVVNILYF